MRKKLLGQTMALIFTSLILFSSFCIFQAQAQTSNSAISYPQSGEIAYATYDSLFMPWVSKEAIVPLWMDFAIKHGGAYESIGKSSAPEQWDIVAFKFGNPDKPAVMINSYLHGNEQYGYEVLYALAQWLVSNDTTAKSILANNYVIFVPVVDYRWARTNYNYQDVTDPFIDIDDNNPAGVDLNRNFSPSWSNELYDQQYSGATPDSEPESQALINAWTKYQPRFYWSLHHGSTRIYTEAIATTDQQQNDLENLKDMLPQIAEDVGVSGSMFKIYVQTEFGDCYGGSGKGFAVDGASSHGAVGIFTELKTSWISTEDVQADLRNGSTFNQAKAFFIALAKTSQIESSTDPAQPTASPSSSTETPKPDSSNPAPSTTDGNPPGTTDPESTLEPSKEASTFDPGYIALIVFVIIIVVASIGVAVNLKKRNRS